VDLEEDLEKIATRNLGKHRRKQEESGPERNTFV
jgi:hypothetical protein